MIGIEITMEMYAAGDLLLWSCLSSAMPSGQLPNQHAFSTCSVNCSAVRHLAWSS